MNETVRLGAGTHAPIATPNHKSFSTLFPEVFGTTDPMFDWEIRPVLVLDSKTEGNRVSTWMPEALGISPFITGLVERGYRGSQCNEVELADAPIEYVWPRNMEWKSLPALATPTFRNWFFSVRALADHGGYENNNFCGVTNFDPQGDYELQKVHKGLVTGVELVVISAATMDDRELRNASAMFDEIAPGMRPRFAHYDGQSLSDIPESEIDRVRKRFLPQERFIFNHAVNMNVMAGRAILKIGKQLGWSRKLAQHFLPRFGHMAWEFGHPLVLQMLFAIQKSGPAVKGARRTALMKLEYGQEPLVLARGLPFTWPKGDRFEFVWTGSGKYTPISLDLGIVSEETAGIGAVRMSRHGDKLFALCRCLIRLGLIDLDGSRVAITEIGVQFLDLIGSEADDPDVLLRWRAGGEEFVHDDHVQDMDRWCNRVFRAIKRKVADLPASYMTEDTGTPWTPEPEHSVIVRGTVLPIQKADLDDPAFTDFLTAAKKGQETLEVGELRRGVMCETAPLDREAGVYAIWIGIPLGILDPAETYGHFADLFKDTAAIDAECLEIMRQADEALPGRNIAAKRIVTFEAFKARATRSTIVRELPDALVVEEGDVVGDIVRGRVLKTQRKPDDPFELKSVYETHLHSPFDRVEIVSGVRCYGDGQPNITLSFGLLLGKRNMRSGQVVLRPGIPKNEVDNLDRQRESVHLRPLLSHSDISEEGVWLILPDGSIARAKDPANEIKPEVARNPNMAAPDAAPEPDETVPVRAAPTTEGTEMLQENANEDRTGTDAEEFEQSAPDQALEQLIREASIASQTPAASHDGPGKSRARTTLDSNGRPLSPSLQVLARVYKEEWIRAADRDGFLAKADKTPMMIASFVGVPDNHADFIRQDSGVAEGERPLCRLVTISNSDRSNRKQKTESEYAQQLRGLLNDGNSVVFVGKDEGHVPSIFLANGPVFQPDYNAFEVAARTLVRMEAELEAVGEQPIEIQSRGQSVPMMDLAIRRDGSILVDGEWEKIHVPAKFAGGLYNFLIRAVKDRNLNIDALAAMKHWAERAKIKGVPHGDGPSSLKEIPGIGRVRKRLEALYSKMEGDGSKIGIVFHGPPGTGKTMLARTLARDTGRHFVLGSFAEWQSSGSGYLGDMLNAMKATFAEAKANQPALLFIDEMDSLGDRTKLESKSKEYITAVINAFLEHVQGFHSRGDVVVVGATNDISRLDPAITRSGRLGEHVRIGLPDRQEIGEIVRWYLADAAKKIELATDVDADRISDLLDGSSPADIGAVIDNARHAAEFEESVMTVGHVLHSINTAAGTTMNAASSEFFCVHEAARLVSLHLLTDISKTVTCARSRPGVSSATGIVLNSDTAPVMSSDLVVRLKANLSGMAAATILNSGTADVGSIARPCIEQARRIATELISLGMGAGNRILFVAMTNGPALDAAVTEWLDWAYKQALELLEPHGETISKVAQEIREREHIGTVGIMEMMDACGLSGNR